MLLQKLKITSILKYGFISVSMRHTNVGQHKNILKRFICNFEKKILWLLLICKNPSNVRAEKRKILALPSKSNKNDL
jgi:hypothetical protein